MTVFRFMKQQLAAYRWRLLGGCGLIMLTLVAAVGLLGLSGWFITATGLAGLGLIAALDIYTPGAGIRLFALTRAVARYGERLLNHDTTLRLLADLRVATFRRFMRLDAARLEACRRGDLLNRLTADIDALDHVFLRVIGPTAAAAALVLLAGTALSLIDLRLGLGVAGVLIAGMSALAWTAHRLGRPTNRALTAGLAELRTLVVEGTQGVAELNVFNAVPDFSRRLGAANDRQLELQRRSGRLAALIQAGASMTGHLAVWIALVIGLNLSEAGRITVPVLALLVLGVLALTEGWLPLPQAWQFLERSRAAARRIGEMTDTPPEIECPESPRPMPESNSLALESVTFRYLPHSNPALDDACLRIETGRRIALSGPSGSGKSTVARLLLRLSDPDSGRVSFGGEDLRDLDPADLRGRISYLSQQPVLFNDTLAANLRLARADASDAELFEALRVACLDEFVERLPDGLRTWIGEMGINLSGGETRRLALARVILKNAPVVILDEPGAGLDAATQSLLSENLDRWLSGRTALIITHDPLVWPWVDGRVEFSRGGP